MMNIFRLSLVFALVIGFGLTTVSKRLNAEPALRTVALSGDAAPGTPSEVFSSFNFPVINDAGQTAFVGNFPFSFSDGVWSEGAGAGLALVARNGDAAPGTGSGVNFGDFGNVAINNAGQTAFRSFLSTSETSIWSEGGGSGLALVAREGDAAPGAGSGVTFADSSQSLIRPVFNDAGQTAFRGILSGTGVTDDNHSGIWSEGTGTGLALVARAGDAAPGTGNGVNFSFFSEPVLNNSGQIAFDGLLRTNTGGFDGSGVWSEGAGVGLALVARRGDAAPGIGGGVNFGNFDNVAINNAGQTAFMSTLNDSDQSIWSEGGGAGLALVAREGDAAPGTGSGVNFDGFNQGFKLLLNRAGQTAFYGTLTGPGVNSSNNRGIWSEGGGAGLALVARTGSAAPGTGSGVNFRNLDQGFHTVLNGAGQIAFQGRLTGPGVNSSNDHGIWAENRMGVLTLIARDGELLDVDDGPGTDFRTISFLSLAGGTGNEDGGLSGFNDLGQLTFNAVFTNGTSGVFVSNLVAIPEPSSLLLFSVATAGLLMRRSR